MPNIPCVYAAPGRTASNFSAHSNILPYWPRHTYTSVMPHSTRSSRGDCFSAFLYSSMAFLGLPSAIISAALASRTSTFSMPDTADSRRFDLDRLADGAPARPRGLESARPPAVPPSSMSIIFVGERIEPRPGLAVRDAVTRAGGGARLRLATCRFIELSIPSTMKLPFWPPSRMSRHRRILCCASAFCSSFGVALSASSRHSAMPARSPESCNTTSLYP